MLCGKQSRDHCESDCHALVSLDRESPLRRLIYHARIYAAAIEKEKKKASISLQVVRERKIVSRADQLNNTISTTDPNA